jgi:hypothetical protein
MSRSSVYRRTMVHQAFCHVMAKDVITHINHFVIFQLAELEGHPMAQVVMSLTLSTNSKKGRTNFPTK